MDNKTTNEALVQYNKALAQAQYSEAEAEAAQVKLTLNDFYTPSKEMKEYQALTMAAVGVTSGLVGHRIYKWMRN